MQRDERDRRDAPSAEEPALLRRPGTDPRPLPRSERNGSGYQETQPNDATAEADREAAGNCALLHRARKESDDGHAPAEESPGSPAQTLDQRGPGKRRPRKPDAG